MPFLIGQVHQAPDHFDSFFSAWKGDKWQAKLKHRNHKGKCVPLWKIYYDQVQKEAQIIVLSIWSIGNSRRGKWNLNGMERNICWSVCMSSKKVAIIVWTKPLHFLYAWRACQMKNLAKPWSHRSGCHPHFFDIAPCRYPWRRMSHKSLQLSSECHVRKEKVLHR